jgi:hypothetical protein
MDISPAQPSTELTTQAVLLKKYEYEIIEKDYGYYFKCKDNMPFSWCGNMRNYFADFTIFQPINNKNKE